MKNTLFNPRRIELPRQVILIPQFWNNAYFEALKDEAFACSPLLGSQLLLFDNFAVVTGFLGYPAMYTVLEFIENLRESEVYFLGTAGSLNPAYDHPVPLMVEEVYPTGALKFLSGDAPDETGLSLKCLTKGNLTLAKGVTVDIIQRETAPWLREQTGRGIDFVEMEIYPLRVYLEKPFHAVVITSDLLTEPGIKPFKDKKSIQKEFISVFELFREIIKEK